MLLSCAILAAVPAIPALAGPFECPDPMLSVEGAAEPQAQRVCEAAMAAKEVLARCGLEQSRPVVLEILPEIDGPAEHCAGLYACGSDRIQIIPPQGVTALMPAESIFSRLQAAEYYDSLVVHELAHALMDQAECAGRYCSADLEYVAYALQIASLPEAGRREVEAFRDVPQPVDPARLNDFLLFLKPDIFAALAWAHFDEPGNGCDFVVDLVSGATSLALPEIME